MTSESRRSWKDVRNRIHDGILSGRYAPGDRLPRDADIAEDMNCARSTVQRAMQDLSDSGLIERRRKGGTRVRPNPVTRAVFDIPVTRLEVEGKGSRYGYQLIRSRRMAAPRPVLAAFDIAGPAQMLRVEALHLSDGQPYIYEDRWISLDTVPEIEGVDLTRENANEWLVQNRPYSRCDLGFFAESADARTAGLLAAPEGAALFVIARTTWIGTAPITSVRAIAAPGYQLLTRT